MILLSDKLPRGYMQGPHFTPDVNIARLGCLGEGDLPLITLRVQYRASVHKKASGPSRSVFEATDKRLGALFQQAAGPDCGGEAFIKKSRPRRTWRSYDTTRTLLALSLALYETGGISYPLRSSRAKNAPASLSPKIFSFLGSHLTTRPSRAAIATRWQEFIVCTWL